MFLVGARGCVRLPPPLACTQCPFLRAMSCHLDLCVGVNCMCVCVRAHACVYLCVASCMCVYLCVVWLSDPLCLAMNVSHNCGDSAVADRRPSPTTLMNLLLLAWKATCVCMCVCAHLFLHVCMHVLFVHLNARACIHACMYAHLVPILEGEHPYGTGKRHRQHQRHAQQP